MPERNNSRYNSVQSFICTVGDSDSAHRTRSNSRTNSPQSQKIPGNIWYQSIVPTWSDPEIPHYTHSFSNWDIPASASVVLTQRHSNKSKHLFRFRNRSDAGTLAGCAHLQSRSGSKQALYQPAGDATVGEIADTMSNCTIKPAHELNINPTH